MVRLVLVCLASALCACTTDDFAILKASALEIAPCKDKKTMRFEPFVLEADLLRWFGSEDVGSIEMRHGYRASTLSDTIVLQFQDTSKVKVGETALDGKEVRLSLALLDTCPDFRQPLVASNGKLELKKFSLGEGGEIEGSAVFDLYDEREVSNHSEALPKAAGVTLDFKMKIRNGYPYEEFAR
jgi:hypothetical protein